MVNRPLGATTPFDVGWICFEVLQQVFEGFVRRLRTNCEDVVLREQTGDGCHIFHGDLRLILLFRSDHDRTDHEQCIWITFGAVGKLRKPQSAPGPTLIFECDGLCRAGFY
ncbi:hypothetical protein D3C71_1667080 [compost metagenome]